MLTIYQAVTNKDQATAEKNFAGKTYAEFKDALAEAVVAFLEPFQNKLNSISDEEVKEILTKGKEKAEAVASKTLAEVKEKVGLG